MEELTPVIDGSGEERRLGLLMPDETNVCAAPFLEDSIPNNILTDDQIMQLITDPGRTAAVDIFDEHWVKEGDQKQHGSCNGWAAGQLLSKTRFKRGLQDGIVMSGSYVYSWINNGQDNGSALDRAMAELQSHGAPPASMCDANKIYRKDTQQFDAEAMKHLGFDAYAIKTKRGLDSALALGFIVGVAVQVNNAFMNYKGQGLIPVSTGNGNHAIHADDIRWNPTTKQYEYRPVNNWNVTWGNRGWGWTTFASFQQTMLRNENGQQSGVHQFYTIVSTQEAGM
jgi:hypothetical protein